MNLIRKNNQTNVTAYHDAVSFHACDSENGVYPTKAKPFGLTWDAPTKTITVGAGMGVIYGRHFEIEEGEAITIDLSALATDKYLTIYAEINLSDPNNQTAIIKANYGDNNYPEISKGDDLTVLKTGVATHPLHWVKYVKSSNTISSEAKYRLKEFAANVKIGPYTYADTKRLLIGECTCPYAEETTVALYEPLNNLDVIEIECLFLPLEYALVSLTPGTRIIRGRIVDNQLTLTDNQGAQLFDIRLTLSQGYLKILPNTRYFSKYKITGTTDYKPLEITISQAPGSLSYVANYTGGVTPSNIEAINASYTDIGQVYSGFDVGFKIYNIYKILTNKGVI